MIRAGDTAEADRFLTQTATETRDADIWRRAARLRIVNRERSGAADALSRARDLSASYLSVLTGAADLGRSSDRPDEAATYLAAAPRADAGDKVWLGVVTAETGDTPAALSAYRAALDGDADNVVALNNLAVLLTRTAPSDALALARRAVDAAGPLPALIVTLGWALHGDGNFSEARAALEASLADRPDSAETQYRLGRTLAELGEADAARATFARALEIDPDFDGAGDARGRLNGQ